MQRAGYGLEHLPGRADMPALLKPGVPRDADARQERDLFPAETPLPAPPHWRKSIVRTQGLVSAGPEEESQFLASLIFHGTNTITLVLSLLVAAPSSTRRRTTAGWYTCLHFAPEQLPTAATWPEPAHCCALPASPTRTSVSRSSPSPT